MDPRVNIRDTERRVASLPGQAWEGANGLRLPHRCARYAPEGGQVWPLIGLGIGGCAGHRRAPDRSDPGLFLIRTKAGCDSAREPEAANTVAFQSSPSTMTGC